MELFDANFVGLAIMGVAYFLELFLARQLRVRNIPHGILIQRIRLARPFDLEKALMNLRVEASTPRGSVDTHYFPEFLTGDLGRRLRVLTVVLYRDSGRDQIVVRTMYWPASIIVSAFFSIFHATVAVVLTVVSVVFEWIRLRHFVRKYGQ